MKGSFGRPTAAYVDGRKVGEADEINTPGQWQQVGEVELTDGIHRAKLERPGPARRPGTPGAACSGRWRSSRVEPSRLISSRPSGPRRLCGRDWDWIELVRP